MTKKIVAFSGNKSAGKTLSAHFVIGKVCADRNLFPNAESWHIDTKNRIVLNVIHNNDKHQVLFDPKRNDPQFQMECSQVIWPHVKGYYFAEELKRVAVDVFGLNPEHVYGSEEDKNEETHISWEKMKKFLPPHTKKKINESGKKNGFLTVRDFLQLFGTEVCRHLHQTCWIDNLVNKINLYQSDVSVIDDLRFNDEAKAIKELGGYIINIDSEVGGDGHESENGIDQHYIDLDIKRSENTIEQQNEKISDFLSEKDFFRK